MVSHHSDVLLRGMLTHNGTRRDATGHAENTVSIAIRAIAMFPEHAQPSATRSLVALKLYLPLSRRSGSHTPHALVDEWTCCQ